MTMNRAEKTNWQREQRRSFQAEHGYSTTADYSVGGKRAAILERDGHKCVRCGMTDDEHKAKWNRPITIDHKNKNRADNTDDNLQTLCLTCHGRKDLLPELRRGISADVKASILRLRESGRTYQSIADELALSIATVWKCINPEGAAR